MSVPRDKPRAFASRWSQARWRAIPLPASWHIKRKGYMPSVVATSTWRHLFVSARRHRGDVTFPWFMSQVITSKKGAITADQEEALFFNSIDMQEVIQSSPLTLYSLFCALQLPFCCRFLPAPLALSLFSSFSFALPPSSSVCVSLFPLSAFVINFSLSLSLSLVLLRHSSYFSSRAFFLFYLVEDWCVVLVDKSRERERRLHQKKKREKE